MKKDIKTGQEARNNLLIRGIIEIEKKLWSSSWKNINEALEFQLKAITADIIREIKQQRKKQK